VEEAEVAAVDTKEAAVAADVEVEEAEAAHNLASNSAVILHQDIAHEETNAASPTL
jgi:hypothetical protein